MAKEYKIQEIAPEVLPPQEQIPGITVPKLNYGTSVGGKDAPADGATKNTGALANLDQVDTAQIVANAVTKVKMALASVDADIVAAGAITESKLYTGAVTADKIAANTITAAKIASHTITASEIAASTITATEINVSQLSAISADIGTITAGTVTGALLQTTSSSYQGVKMSSALSGIVVYGQSITFKDTSNVTLGYVYGSSYYYSGNYNGNILKIVGSSVPLEITSSNYIWIKTLNFVPGDDNYSYLGFSTTASGGYNSEDKTWKYVGAQVVDAKDVYKINNLTCIDQSGNDVYFVGNSAVYIQGSVGTNDIKCTASRIDLYHDTYLSGTLFCTSAGISLNSRTYYGYSGAYDPNKFYLRSA